MPIKKMTFERTVFPPETIQEAIKRLRERTDDLPLDYTGARLVPTESQMNVRTGATRWTFDSTAEFYAQMRQPFEHASVFVVAFATLSHHIDVDMTNTTYERVSTIGVAHPDRDAVEYVMEPFERDAPRFLLAPPAPPEPEPTPPPTVFIGHGGSPAWRDLKDHLQDHHGYRVEAYQTGTRSGHTIRDVLDSMLDVSTFAVIVMTGEDEQPDGGMRARQNVVHEAGLFQGRLGFQRTAILLERGVENLSNLDGIQYIPFSRDHIRETFGDVLAMLRREFPGGA